MLIAQRTARAPANIKGTPRPNTTYRAARRNAAKITYRKVKKLNRGK